ncbi:MAG: modification methylase HemK [Methanosarcinales archaeon]|jgi:release factor glutamine methyltransferase|nr:modification methylase HemK [Methanosarcinales archaeon]
MVCIKYKKALITLMDGVYEPAEDSFLLADFSLKYVFDDMNVLEVGAGTGFVSAVLKANIDINLIATEINPIATHCAKLNGIEVIKTDLFDGLKTIPFFDVILFNSPYLPTSKDEKINGWINYAYDGGNDGQKIINKFLSNVKKYLAKHGVVLLLISSLTGIDAIKDMIEANGFEIKNEESNRYFFEDIIVFCMGVKK